MKNKEKCKDCRYWVQHNSLDSKPLDTGECKVRPPTVLLVISNSGEQPKFGSAYPVTRDTDFCANYYTETGKE